MTIESYGEMAHGAPGHLEEVLGVAVALGRDLEQNGMPDNPEYTARMVEAVKMGKDIDLQQMLGSVARRASGTLTPLPTPITPPEEPSGGLEPSAAFESEEWKLYILQDTQPPLETEYKPTVAETRERRKINRRQIRHRKFDGYLSAEYPAELVAGMEDRGLEDIIQALPMLVTEHAKRFYPRGRAFLPDHVRRLTDTLEGMSPQAIAKRDGITIPYVGSSMHSLIRQIHKVFPDINQLHEASLELFKQDETAAEAAEAHANFVVQPEPKTEIPPMKENVPDEAEEETAKSDETIIPLEPGIEINIRDHGDEIGVMPTLEVEPEIEHLEDESALDGQELEPSETKEPASTSNSRTNRTAKKPKKRSNEPIGPLTLKELTEIKDEELTSLTDPIPLNAYVSFGKLFDLDALEESPGLRRLIVRLFEMTPDLTPSEKRVLEEVNLQKLPLGPRKKKTYASATSKVNRKLESWGYTPPNLRNI